MKIEEIQEIIKYLKIKGSGNAYMETNIRYLESYINQLEADKLEMAEAIVKTQVYPEQDYFACIHCRETGYLEDWDYKLVPIKEEDTL